MLADLQGLWDALSTLPKLNAPRLTIVPSPLLPNPRGYIPQADIKLQTNSPSTGMLAPVPIDPIIPGAGTVFKVLFPISLDGWPIEYGCANEYEQQTIIKIRGINMGFISFIFSLQHILVAL
jgi:hypothetical protein